MKVVGWRAGRGRAGETLCEPAVDPEGVSVGVVVPDGVEVEVLPQGEEGALREGFSGSLFATEGMGVGVELFIPFWRRLFGNTRSRGDR